MGEHTPNEDMRKAWDGDEGAAWSAEWERYDRAIAGYRVPMAEAAAVTDGEAVLDIGCGNGQSARDAARATPSGTVLGLDLSTAMLAQARALAGDEGLTNVTFAEGDAQVYDFGGEVFDVAISRFGSMFFDDKAAAFANIASALRPGGRMLLVVWQEVARNPQFRTVLGSLAAGRELPAPPPGAPGPFGFADVALGRDVLEAAGFADVTHTAVEASFQAGVDVDDAMDFICRTAMAQSLLKDLDDTQRDGALAVLRAAYEDQATPDGVCFDSATWFISARKA